MSEAVKMKILLCHFASSSSSSLHYHINLLFDLAELFFTIVRRLLFVKSLSGKLKMVKGNNPKEGNRSLSFYDKKFASGEQLKFYIKST